VIADWLRITCAEARRRTRDAEQLAPRVTITGETLPPECRRLPTPGETVCWTSSTCG
jgi:hypothetical protein